MTLKAAAVGLLAVAGIAVLAVLSLSSAKAPEVLSETGVRGAGSTFVYPVLSQWSHEYREQRAGGSYTTADGGLDDPQVASALDYEPVGSHGGIQRLKDGAVDFAASEQPLSSNELASSGLAQFPICIGGIVIAVNLDGVGPGEIRFTGPLLADMFLGKITRWSDPAIAALNPTLRLPDAAIVTVHRLLGSGTTFNFTYFLSAVSSEWKTQVGAGLLVPWPNGLAGKGNEGVAEVLKQVESSIGYVEFGQAQRMGLAHAAIQNRAGRFVAPSPATFEAAAAGAEWSGADDFSLLLADAAGDDAYPITATVFALMHKSAAPARNRAALDFFRWSLTKGSSTATRLGYVPLPAPLIEQVEGYWATAFTH